MDQKSLAGRLQDVPAGLADSAFSLTERGNPMKSIQKIAASVIAVTVLSLGGCAGMTQQEKGTAIGAGVGAVGGAVLTGGSASLLPAASRSRLAY